ncbi:MAG: hypothetical protein OXD30_13495 [Bryobacterales bacterium]|nr:hypothetical protein [Bryobacterales bacterium]
MRSGQAITVNGNQYRVTIANGRLVGEFVPQPVSIPVRGSDTPVTILRLEDGSYEHEGTPVVSGDEIEIGDATYELTFSDGTWSASLVAGPIVIVRAGRSEFITLYRQPEGGFEDENGRRVRDGSVVRSASGMRYELALSADGEWSSRIYFPPTTTGTTTGGGGSGSSGGSGDSTVTTVEDLEEAFPDGFLGSQGSMA